MHINIHVQICYRMARQEMTLERFLVTYMLNKGLNTHLHENHRISKACKLKGKIKQLWSNK